MDPNYFCSYHELFFFKYSFFLKKNTQSLSTQENAIAIKVSFDGKVVRGLEKVNSPQRKKAKEAHHIIEYYSSRH